MIVPYFCVPDGSDVVDTCVDKKQTMSSGVFVFEAQSVSKLQYNQAPVEGAVSSDYQWRSLAACTAGVLLFKSVSVRGVAPWCSTLVIRVLGWLSTCRKEMGGGGGGGGNYLF